MAWWCRMLVALPEDLGSLPSIQATQDQIASCGLLRAPGLHVVHKHRQSNHTHKSIFIFFSSKSSSTTYQVKGKTMIQETQRKRKILKYLKPNINIFLASISFTTFKTSKLPICGKPEWVTTPIEWYGTLVRSWMSSCRDYLPCPCLHKNGGWVCLEFHNDSF